MAEDANGNMIPFIGAFVVYRDPRLALVQRIQAAMGNGINGVWNGTIFTVEDGASPATMFVPQHVNTATRIVLRPQYVSRMGGQKTMLMFTDGSCLDNGTPDARGGWAFIFKPGDGGVVTGVLEQKGPGKKFHKATSNRAELRAVIAALEFRAWRGEGWQRIVIVTDSAYVTNGATEWLRNWASRGWRTSSRSPVRNRDLWERLSELMGVCADSGCEVSFWRVPRAWNVDADEAAKSIAENGKRVVDYVVQYGILT